MLSHAGVAATVAAEIDDQVAGALSFDLFEDLSDFLFLRGAAAELGIQEVRGRAGIEELDFSALMVGAEGFADLAQEVRVIREIQGIERGFVVFTFGVTEFQRVGTRGPEKIRQGIPEGLVIEEA